MRHTEASQSPSVPPFNQAIVSRLLIRMLCWLVCFGLVLTGASPLTAQNDKPILPELTQTASERRLSPATAPLQVSRQEVFLNITNAYQPDGIRYLALRLKFYNSGSSEITVATKASRLLIGKEEFLRVQVREELQRMEVTLGDDESSDVEQLHGQSPVVVPADGGRAEAWLVFAKLPRTQELAPMTLQLETSAGPIELELTRIENEGLTAQLERLGPSGRIGIARVSGEINVINVPYFATRMTEYAEQGISRLVISFDQNARIGDELTQEWLVDAGEELNDRLQFYPQWSGLVREAVIVNLPGHSDETGDRLTRSESIAVQKVTRTLIPGLDHATLHREIRSGHPLMRRAILINAGDTIANDDCRTIVGFLDSTEPDMRQAAIQSLRAATDPVALKTLEGIVQTGSPEDAALALKSLMSSQQAGARVRSIQLASEPEIQQRIGLVKILKTMGGVADESWTSFLRAAFQHPDPLAREAALELLLRLGLFDRADLIRTALADQTPAIRDRAFQSMVARRSNAEYEMFVEEALRRIQSGQQDERTLTALREIRDPSVLPQLLKWIDEKPGESLSLVTACVEIGGDSVLGDLLQRFPQFDDDSQEFVLRTLISFRHPESRRQSEQGLLTEENDLYELSRAYLRELGDADAVAAFMKAIDHFSLEATATHRAHELAQDLGWIGTPEAIQALESLRASDNVSRRRWGEAGFQALQSSSPVNDWIQAARVKTYEKDLEGAIQLLSTALVIEPNSSGVHSALGSTQLRLSRWADATASFEKALKLNPDDLDSKTGIAICLAAEGHCDEAIRKVTAPHMAQHYTEYNYLYNVACVYGRSLEHTLKQPASAQRDRTAEEYREKALQFLTASINKGYVDAPNMADDPDLLSIRELPKFQKLLKRIQGLN